MQPETSWTQIDSAAAGDPASRDAFVRRFEPMVRAYLRTRWPRPPLGQEVDDATQEVFVDCFRDGGVLERARRGGSGGFRAFLYGVARNVALRFESRSARKREHPGLEAGSLEQDERTLSRAYDRAWALGLVREAVRRNRDATASRDEAARTRVEILRLRFEEGLPIRDIAARLGMEAARAHHQFATARSEFRRALLEVAGEWLGCCDGTLEGECAALLQLLE